MRPVEHWDGNPEAEWASLFHTSWLIEQRFGKADRSYPTHVFKTFTSAVASEAQDIWADELALTATSRFRGRQTEVNLAFLVSLFEIMASAESYLIYPQLMHYMIERHREALYVLNPCLALSLLTGSRLWSFIVGRSDSNGDSFISQDEQEAMIAALAPSNLKFDASHIEVRHPVREHLATTLKEAGLDMPAETEYTLPSTDGYPYLSAKVYPNLRRLS